MNIPKSLKIALIKSRISPGELAEELSVSKQYISQVVNGNKPPKLATISSICNFLNIKASEFIALGEE